MRIVKYYVCPICGGNYTELHKAIACRNSHEIRTQEWAYCEACGGGWNIDILGEKKENLREFSMLICSF